MPQDEGTALGGHPGESSGLGRRALRGKLAGSQERSWNGENQWECPDLQGGTTPAAHGVVGRLEGCGRQHSGRSGMSERQG